MVFESLESNKLNIKQSPRLCLPSLNASARSCIISQHWNVTDSILSLPMIPSFSLS
jgi:hypothetical protein